MTKPTTKAKAKPKTKAKAIQAPKPEVKTPEQAKLEEELLVQAGVQTNDDGIQQPLDPKPTDETQEPSANEPIQAPKPEDDTNIEEETKEPVTEPETQQEDNSDYFIATHTIKANGMYYNVGDKAPKV